MKATSSCQNLVIGPVVNLSWTDSISGSVTSYEILRSTNGSSYADLAVVSASSASYDDSSVQGLGTTYWYEIEARSPYGSSKSKSVSVTTPLTCVSGSARGESRSDVQQAGSGGTDGDGSQVGAPAFASVRVRKVTPHALNPAISQV